VLNNSKRPVVGMHWRRKKYISAEDMKRQEERRENILN
jgi:hypothetical protein